MLDLRAVLTENS